MIFISGIINIIIQKILCTNKIRLICFCPNCVLFLPEKVIFLFFAGDNCHLARAPMDTMKKLTTSFDTCKSENHCLFRTFKNRIRAYFRVWRQGCAILLRRPCYLPNSSYCFTFKMQLFHPLHVESTFQAFKVPTQIYKFTRVGCFFDIFWYYFFCNWYFSSTFRLFSNQKELNQNHLGV